MRASATHKLGVVAVGLGLVAALPCSAAEMAVGGLLDTALREAAAVDPLVSSNSVAAGGPTWSGAGGGDAGRIAISRFTPRSVASHGATPSAAFADDGGGIGVSGQVELFDMGLTGMVGFSGAPATVGAGPTSGIEIGGGLLVGGWRIGGGVGHQEGLGIAGNSVSAAIGYGRVNTEFRYDLLGSDDGGELRELYSMSAGYTLRGGVALHGGVLFEPENDGEKSTTGIMSLRLKF